MTHKSRSFSVQSNYTQPTFLSISEKLELQEHTRTAIINRVLPIYIKLILVHESEPLNIFHESSIWPRFCLGLVTFIWRLMPCWTGGSIAGSSAYLSRRQNILLKEH